MYTSKIISIKTKACACIIAASLSLNSNAEQTGVYLAPALGYLTHSNEDHAARNAPSASFSLGYQWASPWAAEIAYTRANPDSTLSSDELDSEQFRLDAFYHLLENQKLQPYFVFGGGESRIGNSANEIEETLFNAGLGVKYALNDIVALRSDLRALFGFETESTEAAFNVGVQIFLGGKSSSSKTAIAAAPADSDGDGVNDENDRCANTGAGEKVDTFGCTVIQDSDNDGIPDTVDKCPDTEKNAVVNTEGCYKTLKEDVSFALNITFANNSDEVISDNLNDIRALATFMTSYPQTSATIEGHTDSSGAAAYNKTLSLKRAEAVKQLLITTFGIDAARLYAKGFGEESPIATNDTAEGRAKNRRVEAQIKATIEKTIK